MPVLLLPTGLKFIKCFTVLGFVVIFACCPREKQAERGASNTIKTETCDAQLFTMIPFSVENRQKIKKVLPWKRTDL